MAALNREGSEGNGGQTIGGGLRRLKGSRLDGGHSGRGSDGSARFWFRRLGRSCRCDKSGDGASLAVNLLVEGAAS